MKETTTGKDADLGTVHAPLTLDDIVDLRAYERERPAFRSRVIDLKQRRRVTVGPFVTFVFENRDTVRFQVQEMARAERMLRDEQIQTELDTYNALLPSPGELSATMFLELTTTAELEEWLPKLIGIEQSAKLVADGAEIPSVPEAGHAAQLTRETVTSAVHYVRFPVSADQADQLRAARAVALRVDHPMYAYDTELHETTRKELLADLT
ncbi:MAG TPA: DUF3501 family protein [Acidimicrobiales bacterium]|nr:DUF3501 family protein [Acidimicrobiales bacterium]